MDLSTVIAKIDLHKYVTVKEYLYDVDLIWQNCLEYNPDKDPSGVVFCLSLISMENVHCVNTS